MVEAYSIAALATGLILISISLYKLKKQTISQGTFVVWMLGGLLSIGIASTPLGFSTIQELLGTELSISAVFGVTIIPLGL